MFIDEDSGSCTDAVGTTAFEFMLSKPRFKHVVMMPAMSRCQIVTYDSTLAG